MPKMKTRKTISKRFKLTSTGKILRGHQYSRHRKSHKSKRLKSSYHRHTLLNTKQINRLRKFLSK